MKKERHFVREWKKENNRKENEKREMNERKERDRVGETCGEGLGRVWTLSCCHLLYITYECKYCVNEQNT
jgi:hypothetical protein